MLPGYHPGLGTKYDFLQSLSKTVSKLSCSARCQAFCVPDRPFPYWSDFNEHRSAASMKRQPWKAERCINSWRVFNGGLISAGHFKEPLEEELFARGADDEAPWIDCVGFMHSDATLYTDGSRKPKKEKPQVLEHHPAKRQLCYMLTFQPRIEVSASRLV